MTDRSDPRLQDESRLDAVKRAVEDVAQDAPTLAKIALEAMSRTGLLLATCQLGITVSSVLLGAISEAALHHALEPVVHHLGLSDAMTDAIALVLAILVVVYLHVVVGEMIPKNLAIAAPERVATILVPPLVLVSKLTHPLIRAMDVISKLVVRAFGVEPKDEVGSTFTAEEVQHIVEESVREGLVEEDQFGLLGAALEFSDKLASDVAIDREALVTVPVDCTPDDLERLAHLYGASLEQVAHPDRLARHPDRAATGPPHEVGGVGVVGIEVHDGEGGGPPLRRTVPGRKVGHLTHITHGSDRSTARHLPVTSRPPDVTRASLGC